MATAGNFFEFEIGPADSEDAVTIQNGIAFGDNVDGFGVGKKGPPT